MPSFAPIEAILNTAVPFIAENTGASFSRKIRVCTTTGGDIRVREEVVIVHPKFATTGDPIHVCLRILSLCKEFDEREKKERESRRVSAYAELEWIVKFIRRKYPNDDIIQLVQEILDSNEEETVYLGKA